MKLTMPGNLMHRTPLLAGLFMIGALLFLSGCGPKGTVIWSPDGSRGVYVLDDQAQLIDQDGNVVQQLGECRSVVWSSDSKTLYFNRRGSGKSPVKITVFDNATTQAATLPAGDPPAERSTCEVLTFADGKIQSLAELDLPAARLSVVSPDNSFLILIDDAQPADAAGVVAGRAITAYQPATKTQRRLGTAISSSACFTAPTRLAFIAPMDAAPAGELLAAVTEIDLNAAKLDPQKLLYVVGAADSKLAAVGDNLLVSTYAAAFPMPAKDADPKRTLYQWTRANNAVTPIVEDLADGDFSVSPDQKRLLLHRATTVKDGKAVRNVVTVRMNGSDPQTVALMSDGFIPTWRGNRQVTYAAPASDGKVLTVGDKRRAIMDVLLVEVDEQGTLGKPTTLSRDWDDSRKPYVQSEAPAAATSPAPNPMTEQVPSTRATAP